MRAEFAEFFYQKHDETFNFLIQKSDKYEKKKDCKEFK